jgi:hypothetical protein
MQNLYPQQLNRNIQQFITMMQIYKLAWQINILQKTIDLYKFSEDNLVENYSYDACDDLLRIKEDVERFANGAMSAAFRVAFNEAITKNDSLDSKLTVVAHLDDEGDKVGHAFVILENADGERIARGFWPGKRNGEKYRSIIIGNGFSGAVRDEVDTGYLERYDAWLKTGVDPVRGRFAHRTYNISSKQYGSATSLINNWNKSYNLGCMCGTFTEAVAASTGNILFNNDIRSKRYTAPRPTAIFNLLKDN